LCQRGEISKDILPAFLTNYSIESLIESDGEKWVILNRLYIDENLISEEVEFHDLQLRIKKALLTMSDREREIIKMRNGFYDNRVYSLEEIGIKFGVTRERIRQIEEKTLKKLRHPSRRKYFER
jgi:RNA polymerase sigma factor (sigma-70 family)